MAQVHLERGRRDINFSRAGDRETVSPAQSVNKPGRLECRALPLSQSKIVRELDKVLESIFGAKI